MHQFNSTLKINVVGSIFAKEAADIFATQSDLPNIVEGIAQTRLLFDNFRKTLAYNLSHLLPEILPVLLSFILGLPLALNSVQVSDSFYTRKTSNKRKTMKTT